MSCICEHDIVLHLIHSQITTPLPPLFFNMIVTMELTSDSPSEISSYDLSIMYLNGYIDDDGNVTTTPNLFDANILQKMADIDEILLIWNPEENNSISCKALFQKFHAPCKSDK